MRAALPSAAGAPALLQAELPGSVAAMVPLEGPTEISGEAGGIAGLIGGCLIRRHKLKPASAAATLTTVIAIAVAMGAGSVVT
jgi:hypothetical protein